MLIVKNWVSFKPEKKIDAVLTIGVFDGLHLGHRYLIDKVINKARALSCKSLVMTFEPYPLDVLTPKSAPGILSYFEQKTAILESWGVDIVGVINFSQQVAQLSPQNFLNEYITSHLNLKEMIVGDDFVFGYKASGHLEFLKAWAKQNNIKIEAVFKLSNANNIAYSSSEVRRCLNDGSVDVAALILGRPYSLKSLVVHGLARGRQLGYPTANLGEIKQMVPKSGVYATIARFDGKDYKSVSSVGYNLTFDQQNITVECHVLDFSGDLYGKELEIFFVKKIREMEKFSSVEELIKQLREDASYGKSILDKFF